jgi:phosphopantetheinyl transferase
MPTVRRLPTVRVVHVTLDPPTSPVARAAALVVLGRELGVAPEAVEITRECVLCGDPNHGKPRLVNDPSISFNLSHSGAHAVVAVARDGVVVGVDVETVRPRTHLARLAARTLTPAQLDAWHGLAADQQLEFFLRGWTAKEAYLKAIGTGVTTMLKEVPDEPDGWSLHALAVPEGYVGTLAVDARDVTIEEMVFSSSAGTEG